MCICVCLYCGRACAMVFCVAVGRQPLRICSPLSCESQGVRRVSVLHGKCLYPGSHLTVSLLPIFNGWPLRPAYSLSEENSPWDHLRLKPPSTLLTSMPSVSGSSSSLEI